MATRTPAQTPPGAPAQMSGTTLRRTPGSPPFDAVVVLGTRVEADGRASAPLARRVRRGVALVQAGAAPLLLLSGGQSPGGSQGVPNEAEVMADLAREAGLTEESLLLECKSRSTWENAVFCSRLLAARGLGSALVVTDRLHLRRALLCFRRCGLQVAGQAAQERWRDDPPRRIALQAVYESAALLRYLPRLLRPPPTE